jgi:hypothetical protein
VSGRLIIINTLYLVLISGGFYVSLDKITFKEPIVRVKVSGMRFPKVCPVCGDSATTKTRVSTIPNKKTWLRPGWDPAFTPSVRRRLGITTPPTSTFLVPVCDNHIISDESDCRYRTLCMVSNGLIIAIGVFSLMTVGSDLWLGRGFGLGGFMAIFLLSIAISSSIVAFRSRPLEAAFKIIGFDYGTQYVYIGFKDTNYRQMFLEENEMNAELVSWIVRA